MESRAKFGEESAEDSGLFRNQGCSLATALGLVTSCPGRLRAPGDRSLHIRVECAVCTRSRKGEEEGWSSSASVLNATRTGEEGARPHSQNGPRQCLPGLARSEEFASPTSPPNLVWLSVRSRRESQSQKEETLSRGPSGLLDLGRPPTFRPIVPP